MEPSSLIDDYELYEKSSDILDVWFDSGVTHHCVLEQRENLSYPADLGIRSILPCRFRFYLYISLVILVEEADFLCYIGRRGRFPGLYWKKRQITWEIIV